MDTLTVVDVKSIIAVVSMVPDFEVTLEGDIVIPEGRFFLMESPFLATVSRTLDNDEGDDNGIAD
jgi:hypothetical protein